MPAEPTIFNNESDFRMWLNNYDADDQAPDKLLSRFISGIKTLGINVYRSSMWLPTSHPELWGTQLIWTSEAGTELFRRAHDITSTPIYMNTPGEAVYKTRKALRWKLDVAAESLPYPLLQDVKNEGGMDYLIVPFHTDDDREQPWITFATKSSNGFTELEIQLLKELCIPLSWKARVTIAEIATQSLLSVYLGSNAAQRVMNGQFKRGTGETINAIIWFCDLRGFTALGENRTNVELVNILDHFFECFAGPIENSGGEILKFIGDSMLAIFPFDPTSSCDKILDAAQQALKNLKVRPVKQMVAENLVLEAGIALHIGEMLFGNIGGSSRLDFTVIGSAVNEASRLEDLCKSTYPILATKEFAQHVGKGRMISIGKKQLRGVVKNHEIFTLKEFV